MGYLINPTAMRVGWFQDWNNSLYIDNRYYPQLLHIVLKLRVYLLYILNQPKWRNKKWLYNHLIITCDYWGIKVHVYYYDGKLEDSWRNYTEQVSMYKSVLRKYIDKQQSQKNYRAHLNNLEDFFLIMSVLLLYSPLQRSYQISLNKFMSSKLFNNLPVNKPAPLLFSTYRRDQITKTRMDLYYNLLLNVVQTQFRISTSNVLRNYKLRGSNMLGIAKWYYIIYDTVMGSKPVLNTFASWISLIFVYMYSINLKVGVNFYLISNEHVTANFLAIYIAQRLKQKYRLKFLINPLLYELKRIKKVNSQTNKNKYSLNRLKVQLVNNYNLYTHSLKFLFNFYFINQYQWFTTTCSWVNYDTLLSQSAVSNYLLNDNFQHNFLLDRYLLDENQHIRAGIFGICRIANSKRAHILFFVKSIYYKLYTTYLLKINKNKTNNLNLRTNPDYFIFVREMFYDLANNFANVSKNDNFDFIFTNISKLPVWYSLRIGLKSLARLEYFNYFIRKSNYIYHKYNISKSTIQRNKVKNKNVSKGLVGYKIQLKGRFTRKQIAAKHVFKGGNVPLNTLNSKIDYGFATVPIKNSAIGVKVWLYRGNSSSINCYMIKIV